MRYSPGAVALDDRTAMSDPQFVKVRLRIFHFADLEGHVVTIHARRAHLAAIRRAAETTACDLVSVIPTYEPRPSSSQFDMSHRLVRDLLAYAAQPPSSPRTLSGVSAARGEAGSISPASRSGSVSDAAVAAAYARARGRGRGRRASGDGATGSLVGEVALHGAPHPAGGGIPAHEFHILPRPLTLGPLARVYLPLHPRPLSVVIHAVRRRGLPHPAAFLPHRLLGRGEALRPLSRGGRQGGLGRVGGFPAQLRGHPCPPHHTPRCGCSTMPP